MNAKNGIALKSGIWYTISDFLLRAIGLITTPIFTRLLTHAEFGEFSNFHSWQLIFTILITFNIGATLISAKYDFGKEFNQYILSISYFMCISTAAFLMLLNAFGQTFASWLNMDTIYINVMVVYILTSAIFGLFQTRERYLYRYKTSVIFSLINSALSTLVSIIFSLLWSDRLRGRIIGMALPTIILGVVFFLVFIKDGTGASWKRRLDHIKYALPICLPYIPHSLSLILLSAMDKIQITSMCGSEDTALYSVAYTCGSAITLFLSSMNNAFVPWLGDHINAKDYEPIRRMSKFYIGGFVFAAIGVMLLTPELLLVAGGKSYLPARFVMTPVSLGIIFQFLYTMLVNIEQIEKNTKPMALATVTAALFNYITNAFFIRKLGYIAAAYTTVGSYLLLLILHMIIVHKMGMNNVYNYKYMWSVAGISIILTIFIIFLFNSTPLRYVTVVVYVIVAYLLVVRNRGKLNILVKLLRKRS